MVNFVGTKVSCGKVVMGNEKEEFSETFLSSFIGITLSLFMSQQHIEEAKLRT